MASGFAAPVTREKSQFRAQHDSPSLSPAHDGIQPLSNFRALAALFLWAAYFSPQHHAGASEFGSFAPLLFFSRFTAGAVGFLLLSQSGEWPGDTSSRVERRSSFPERQFE